LAIQLRVKNQQTQSKQLLLTLGCSVAAKHNKKDDQLRDASSTFAASMNWFVYFTITTIFAVPVKVVATEEECDKDKAAQFVEFAKGMHQQDQLIEPTFTIHDPEEDLKDVQDRLEQILNRGIENSVVYYKVVERKTAITCITGKHSTAVVILQLKETECEKATALADEEQRQSCQPKEDGITLECAWSSESLTSPFTYGFWCAETIEEPFSYPEPEKLCAAWRYEDTAAYRLPVPEAYRPWSVEMDAYAPPNCVWHQHFGTDCVKLSMEQVEGSNQLPPEDLRHKDGRTGMRGRGTNGKFGGNAFYQILILRKTEQGDKQVLMHRLPLKMGYFTLPMFPGANMPFAHALGKKVMREMTSKVTECGTAAMEDLFKATTRLYGGPMWNPRNTDNSWMTMNSLVISEESYLENIKHGSDSDFKWLSINETTEQYLKDVLTEMYPAETAEKLMEPTGSIKEKLLLARELGIVPQTIGLANCAALFHPFVPMGLESQRNIKDGQLRDAPSTSAASMNWFVYFTITTIFALPVKAVATEEECDKDKAAQFVKFAKGMHQQDQLIEPTFTIHDPTEDLQEVQDRLQQILNRGIEKPDVYYKVVETKTAITCTTGKHSTAVVILQLKETECEKATALTDETERQSCEPKEDGRTLECAWSGEALTSPFTYGFWCAETTEEPFSYPEPEELCAAWRYEDTAAYRLPVPEAYRPWSVEMDAYAPPNCVWHQHFGTDCVKLSMEQVEGSNQLPPEDLRHKDGRTGMRGRGTNGKFGGNAFYQILILRKTEQGDKQVLMHRLPLKMGYFTLPMFPGANMPFAHALGKKVMREMTSKVTECGTAAMEDLMKATTKLYEGPMWAPRNTDNSWMIMNSLIISEESYLENIKHGSDSDFTWLSINETTEQYLKDVLTETYPAETAEKLMEPTGSIKEKLLLARELGIVPQTIGLANCAALFHPFVPMGLEVGHFFGILALAVFYF
ncbi:hypothetical protein M513_13559, partial [Trichuris suis]